jgi:hypothetical protein
LTSPGCSDPKISNTERNKSNLSREV